MELTRTQDTFADKPLLHFLTLRPSPFTLWHSNFQMACIGVTKPGEEPPEYSPLPAEYICISLGLRVNETSWVNLIQVAFPEHVLYARH